MRANATLPRRRWWTATCGGIAAALAAPCGCSGTKPKKSGRSAAHRRPQKGPKTMGDLLVGEYIADLKNGPAEKRIAAARELGNMGTGAKKALPALEALAKDDDAQVRTAVQKAIREIRK